MKDLPLDLRPLTLVNVLEGYQLWAEHYDTLPNPLLALEERELPKLLPDLSNKAVADIACGTGRWMRLAHRRGARSVFGVDLSSAMLGQAAQHDELQGCLTLANAQHLPLKTASLDVLICSFALGYFPKLRLIASEFRRILKVGGRLFCSDFHPTNHHRWKRSFKKGEMIIEIQNIPHPEKEILSSFNDFFCLTKKLDLLLGEPERPLFVSAGKTEVFQDCKDLPVVLLIQWQKV